jgi:hypothetical protein
MSHEKEKKKRRRKQNGTNVSKGKKPVSISSSSHVLNAHIRPDKKMRAKMGDPGKFHNRGYPTIGHWG